jgi:DNA-directed RNA polymerase specialized sigma subunit
LDNLSYAYPEILRRGDEAVNDLPNIMTREEFVGRWTEIQKTYGTSRQTAGARFEQTIGELFNETASRSWTQEMIAAEVGMSGAHVSRMLTFGAFISFLPQGNSEDLAVLKQPLHEKRFRSFWSQTKDLAGNDRKRYQKTWELILAAEQDEAAGGRKTPRDFSPVRQALGKKFSDGKWHDASKIAGELDVDEELLAEVATSANKFRLKDFPYELEDKPYGRSKRYRIFRTDRQLSRQRILEELAPIAEGLQEQGKKNGVTISVVAVARLAHQLKTLMAKWEDE